MNLEVICIHKFTNYLHAILKPILIRLKKVPIMNMPLNFEVQSPPDFADAVQLTQNELNRQILLMAALKMFELGKISSGKAAQLAGMTRVDFLEICGEYKVSIFNYQDDEIEDELLNDLKNIEKTGL